MCIMLILASARFFFHRLCRMSRRRAPITSSFLRLYIYSALIYGLCFRFAFDDRQRINYAFKTREVRVNSADLHLYIFIYIVSLELSGSFYILLLAAGSINNFEFFEDTYLVS